MVSTNGAASSDKCTKDSAHPPTTRLKFRRELLALIRSYPRISDYIFWDNSNPTPSWTCVEQVAVQAQQDSLTGECGSGLDTIFAESRCAAGIDGPFQFDDRAGGEFVDVSSCGCGRWRASGPSATHGQQGHGPTVSCS